MSKAIIRTYEKVVYLSSKEHLSNMEIAQRLNISRQMVHKHLKKYHMESLFLPKKKIKFYVKNGGGSGLVWLVDKSGINLPKIFRLHALQIRCKVYYQSKAYVPNRKYAFEKYDVHTHNSFLNIYIKTDFYGFDLDDCDAQARVFIVDMLEKLPLKIGAYVSKNDRYVTISKAHYAHLHHPLAILTIKKGSKFVLRDKKDGKARIIVDRSKNVPELEFLHPIHARDDIENFEDFCHEIVNTGKWKKISDDSDDLRKRVKDLSDFVRDLKKENPVPEKWLVEYIG